MKGDGVCRPGVIEDISVGGCRIVTPYRGLVSGDEICMNIKFDNKFVELMGEVVHFYPPTKQAVVGVEFYRSCVDSYRELVKFIYSDEAAHIAVIAKATQAKNKKDL